MGNKDRHKGPTFLLWLRNPSTPGNPATEIENPNASFPKGVHSYEYDGEGSLVEETHDGKTMTITWNPARKPLKVQFPNGNVLEFEYDGMGHRALKRFTRAADTLVVTTRYVRDAQGNTLAIYTAQDTTARLIGTPQVDHEDERIRSIRYLRDNLTPTQFADLLADWLAHPFVQGILESNGSNPNFIIPCCTTAACTTLETIQQKAAYILQTYSTSSQYDECLEALISLCQGNDEFYDLMVDNNYTLDPAGRRKESRLGVKLAEQHLYGSSRLGIDLRNEPVYSKTFTRLWNPWLEAWNTPTTVFWTPEAADANRHSFVRGRKRYELSNHLGNVSAVVSDKKLMTDLDSDGSADEFRADVRTAQDYYAFGSPRYDRKAKLPTTTEVIVCRIRVHRFEMNDCIHIVIPPVLTEDVTNSYCYDNAIPLDQALQELVSQFTFNSSYVATVEGTDIILKTTVANLENLRYCDFPVRVAVTQGTAKAEVIDAYQCPEAYRYAFNGKESDKEVYGEDNFYDYDLRNYDPRIGRWLSVDPVVHPHQSPYCAFDNNPIYFIDPKGSSTEQSPIYDGDGNFLGTDDQGLQGEAIVMNKDRFEQGMSHDEALQLGTPLNTLQYSPFITEQAVTKINDHFNELPCRPDYDGRLTLSEANDWYRGNSGNPLFVDLASIDFTTTSKSDFDEYGYVNLFLTQSFQQQALGGGGNVYGSIKLNIATDLTVTSPKKYSDYYNFDQKSWGLNPGRWLRNIGTAIGNITAGKGTPYDIFFYGKNKLSSYEFIK